MLYTSITKAICKYNQILWKNFNIFQKPSTHGNGHDNKKPHHWSSQPKRGPTTQVLPTAAVQSCRQHFKSFKSPTKSM